MFSTGSPSQGQLQIGIALVLQDRFSNQAREASSQIRRLHNEAKILTNANLNLAKNLSSIGLAAGSAVSYGLASAIQQGAEFVDTMTFVDAIATKDGITLDQLSKKARSLGRDTMFTSRDIASGMQYMAMAGMTATEIFNNIEGAAHLAGGTMSALGGKGGAADILTNVMKMFRITSSEINSTRVADVLTKGVTSANISLYDLAESIKYAGTTVTNLGGSLEQTVAFIGMLGNAGIQGSMAGTAISNTYRYLTKSIEDTRFKGHKALVALGLGKQDFVDANGRLIDMGLAMEKIAKATRGMSDTERFNTLVSILGVRGERGGTSMIKALEDYSTLLEKVQNESQGSAAQIMAERMDNIAGSINKVTSTLENIKTSYTEAISPIVKPILNTIAFIFEGISSILGTPVLGTLLSGIVTVSTALFTMKMGVIALKATWKLWFNDSTLSFANMISVMKAGWRGASASAAQYQAIEAGIIAQRKAGMVSNAAGAATFSAVSGLSYIQNNPGQRAGGIFFSKGRYFQDTPGKGATGVTRISAVSAANQLAGKTPQQLGLVTAAPIAASRTLGLAGIGRGILGFGSKLLGFLGGPIGIGITALSIILPSILSSLNSNKDAINSNTDTINKDIADRNSKNKDVNGFNTLTDEEQRIMMATALNNLADTLKNRPIAQLHISVDGKDIISRIIKDGQIEDISNIGAK